MAPGKTFSLSKTVVSSFFLLLGFVWLWQCAVRGTPGGGPIDKTPPTIIENFPAKDSTNIRQLEDLHFSFSERMNDGSSSGNVFISPPMKFETEWKSYEDFEIHLKDSLKTNQTYVVVLGSAFEDLHGNKLAESFQLAFSTGNKIDKGKINGRIYGTGRNQNISLFAYYLDSTSTDSMLQREPDYISQAGKGEEYDLGYLRFGKYRIFAVNDQNQNYLLDAGFESFAIPFSDIRIDSLHPVYSGLNFRMTRIDTTAPRLQNIRAVNNQTLRLRFSEQLNTFDYSRATINDSISGKYISIITGSPDVDADNSFDLYTMPLDSGRVYLFRLPLLSDSSGNSTRNILTRFTGSEKVYQDSFKVLEFTPADSTKNVRPDARIELKFSGPVNRDSLEKGFQLLKTDGTKVKGSFLYKTGMDVTFVPWMVFGLGNTYRASLDKRIVCDPWGKAAGDSVVRHIFLIQNGDDYGEISGTINFPGKANVPLYAGAQKIGSGKEKYFVRADRSMNYILKYLPEGFYKMEAFADTDSSATYSAGTIFPFRFSEPFTIKSDTVKVRKRWETSGVIISLPKAE